MSPGQEDKHRNFLEALGESVFLLSDDELIQELEEEGTTLEKAAADFDTLFLGSLKSFTLREREQFQAEESGQHSSPNQQSGIWADPLKYLRKLIEGRPELVYQCRNFEKFTDEEATDAIQDILELIDLEND